MNESVKEIDGNEYVLDRHKRLHEHHTINGFLGVFHIGEIRKGESQSMNFMFSNKIIFSTRIKNVYVENVFVGKQVAALHEENYKKLKLKLSL